MPLPKLAARLLEAGLITDEDVKKLAKQQHVHGGSEAANLVKLSLVSEEQLAEFLGRLYRVPCLKDEDTVDGDAVRLVPQEIATKFQLLPVRREGRQLTVAMVDPDNVFAIDDIKFLTGFDVQPLVAAETTIKRLIDRHYDQADSMAQVLESLEDLQDLEVLADVDTEEVDIAELGDVTAPVVKIVNSLLADAVLKGASDIHIEPYERTMRVRFRIDGVLYEVMKPPVKMKLALISRIKIMADLDIAERRIPQDGRIKIKIAGKMVDLRVSTLPTIFGEKVVIRILDKSNLRIDLSEFGMERDAYGRLVRAIESPYGMVLVTGPTGSGKTTTLYSALSRINVPGVNITTAEDPVEYNLDGINQVQINEVVGLSFAHALRSFLRQDPNIILVGEIRDLDTGSIAVKAALTGHLVLSTLHTNDAPSTVGRLVDMGLEPFLVAASVNLIVAQRLVRRLCTKCKKAQKLGSELAEQLGIPDQAGSEIYAAVGCDRCSETGFKGRQGLYEVMPISLTLRRFILERKSATDLKAQALKEGMLTLRMDGIQKLLKGITSVDEVLKETATDQVVED